MSQAIDVEMVDGIPEEISAAAQKWGEAASISLATLQNPGLESLKARMLLEIALHTAAAVFGPGEYDATQREEVVGMFRDALASVSEQYLQDKASFESEGATKQ